VTTATIDIPVDDVVYRDDLYPRLKTNPATVQQYAEQIEMLPPIEVNQHNELIDGWHRWTAHRKLERQTIAAFVTPTASDARLLELAVQRNAAFGLQLSIRDKQFVARRIYHETPERERPAKKLDLARILSVAERTVREWLARIDKDAKDARDERIRDLWLACWTQQEIAEAVGVHKDTVSEVCRNLATLPESDKPAANHLVDFKAPIFNVWKWPDKTEALEHFGNSEPGIVDNLLYLYTKPLDIVIDPFAGGGSTIDVCKQRWRRYLVSDRKPILERAAEIRRHDVAAGPLKPPRWEDVRLVYLDPPYWRQAAGEYSDDPEDLANMDLEAFHAALAKLIGQYAAKLPAGAVIALLMQPTQWNSGPDHAFVPHVLDISRRVKLPVDLQVQCPYESQQANAQMVEWAKANRKCLVLSRELVIWRKGT
jgi:transcriptional regulator with XRE-family HTH domain